MVGDGGAAAPQETAITGVARNVSIAAWRAVIVARLADPRILNLPA